ncbi:MAG: EamA family transporter [Pseudomonadota bacterium]
MPATKAAKRTTLRDTLLTGIAPCIWGSTYIVTTQMLPPNHPLTAAAIRVLPVGFLLLALTRAMPPREWWGRLILLGLLNIGVFQSLLFIAAYRVPGGVAATVGAIQPLVVVVLSWAALNATYTRQTWLAAIGGMIGVGLLVMGPGARLDALGIAAAFFGAVASAIGIVLTKRWKPPLTLASFTGWQLVFGGVFILPFAIALEEPIHTLTLNNIIGFAFLSIAGSGLGYALWFRGISRLQTSAVSILTLLSPVVASLLGYLILQQSFTVPQLFGVGLVLASVWLGQR